MKYSRLLLASGLALQACIAQAQIAGDETAGDSASGSDQGQDIVVTAQRRSESAQDVPISLTVVSSEMIKTANITNVLDIGRVAPGFTATRAPQAANTRLSIRGIGSSGNAAIEPSVGAYVDGIYIARPGPLLAALNDVASVEVLRGPQGTLFGRNASVGALNISTTTPTRDLEGHFSAEYGSYDRYQLNGVVNAPLSEALVARVAVVANGNDGYIRNIEDGQRLGRNRTLGLRAAVNAELSPEVRWIVRGDYQRQRGDGLGPVTVLADTVTPAAAANFNRNLAGMTPRLDASYNRNVRQISGGRLRDEQWGLASDFSVELGDYTLRLISGYRDWNNSQYERDVSQTSADLLGRHNRFTSTSHSEEFQIISPAEDAFSFVAGAYYFREDYGIRQSFDLGPGYCDIFVRNTMPARLAGCLAGPQAMASESRFDQRTTSYAVFGQATYDVTDQWAVTAGIRYSHDSKDAALFSRAINPAAVILIANDSADLAFDGGKVTYRINTTFKPDRDVMLFATISTGYKSGGFDSGFNSTAGNNRVFDPETVTNYEVGIKAEWWDRRVTTNLTLFRMDVDKFQLRSYDGLAFSVRNAGSLRQQGAEFDVSMRPADGLTLGLSGTYLDSAYTDFRNAPGLPGFGGVQDMTGHRVTYSPKWQGVASLDYRGDLTGDLSFGFNTRLAFTSEVDLGPGDGNPQNLQDGYALWGARATLYGPSDRWELSLSGENLANQHYCSIIYAQVLGGPLGLNDRTTGGTVQRCILGEPRVLRVSGTVRF